MEDNAIDAYYKAALSVVKKDAEKKDSIDIDADDPYIQRDAEMQKLLKGDKE